MPYRSQQEHEKLKQLLKSLEKFKKYESFSSTPNHPKGHAVYNNIFDEAVKTASGLIYDALATTEHLSPSERQKHKYAEEVFGAFCIHHCVLALMNPRRYSNVGLEIATDVCTQTYESVIRTLKRLINNGEQIINLRAYLINLTRLRERNIYFDSLKDSNTVPFELSDADDDNKVFMHPELVEKIIQDSEELMRKQNLYTDMNQLLDECLGKKIITQQDKDIICHSFGIGNGYEKLTQAEIGQELDMKTSTVSRHLKAAVEKLRDYIMAEDEYSHLRPLV